MIIYLHNVPIFGSIQQDKQVETTIVNKGL